MSSFPHWRGTVANAHATLAVRLLVCAHIHARTHALTTLESTSLLLTPMFKETSLLPTVFSSASFSLDNTDGYDPDYDFLHQDLSVSEPLPFPTVPSSSLSPLPEILSEAPVISPGPAQPRFSAPVVPLNAVGASNGEQPPALPQKKRRSAPILSSCQSYEFRPDEDTPTSLTTPNFTNGTEFSSSSDSPPPLPEKKCRTSKSAF